MKIKSIEYRIMGSSDLDTCPIKKTMLTFKESKEGENYEKYGYPFSTCLIRFLIETFDGIEPLDNRQYEILKNRFDKL